MTQKIALVTGGAQGIGYACAEALAEDGYRLVLADIQDDKVAKAAQQLGGSGVLGVDGRYHGAIRGTSQSGPTPNSVSNHLQTQ